MIRLSVFYPSSDDSTFDHDYYKSSHVPLCEQTWSPVSTHIDKGVDGPNVAAVHVLFESAEAMQAAMALPGTAKIMEDIANYTNISPVLQVSEVVS